MIITRNAKANILSHFPANIRVLRENFRHVSRSRTRGANIATKAEMIHRMRTIQSAKSKNVFMDGCCGIFLLDQWNSPTVEVVQKNEGRDTKTSDYKMSLL
jgi:hypothetical protein